MLKFKYENWNLEKLKESYEHQIKNTNKQIDKLFARKEGLEIALDILSQNTEKTSEEEK